MAWISNLELPVSIAVPFRAREKRQLVSLRALALFQMGAIKRTRALAAGEIINTALKDGAMDTSHKPGNPF